MRNLRVKFQQLLRADPLLVGTVASQNADGTSTLTLPAGGTLRVQGTGVAVGLKAFSQGGRVQGEAPNLPVTEITI